MKAIKWWSEEHNAKQQLPFAWPQVTFILEDGTKETKPILHVRNAWERWRKDSKGKKEGA